MKNIGLLFVIFSLLFSTPVYSQCSNGSCIKSPTKSGVVVIIKKNYKTVTFPPNVKRKK